MYIGAILYIEVRLIKEINKMNYEILRNRMYANSPYDLASERDDAYRNGVDAVIEAIEKLDREVTEINAI